MSATKNYINNPDFLKALVDYKTACKKAKKEKREDPPIPNYIGECFMKIAENFSHKHNYINYTYRDEMVSDGVENCVMYFRNFNPAISKNPFAYFTQIIYYAFLRRIEKEKKQLYLKYKMTLQSGMLDELESSEDTDGVKKQFELYDNIAEFIDTYETTKRNKKKEASKKAAIKLKGLEKFVK